MHRRPDIDTASDVARTIVENGSPMLQLGSVSCSLNGIHAYYQEIKSIEVEAPRFAQPTMTIRFRRGVVLIFKGPHPWQAGRKKFLEEVGRAENNIRVLAFECWKNLLTAHFSRGRPFSIDAFRFAPTGEIQDEGAFLTNIYSDDFRASACPDGLLIEYRTAGVDGDMRYRVFEVGLSPQILASLLMERRKEQVVPGKSNTWSNFEERAVKSLMMMAAISGGWNRKGLEHRLKVFATKRGIDFASLRFDLENLDLIKLALDKRVVRNLYSSFSSFCAVPERASKYLFDDLVPDLVRVAADGQVLSDIAVYFIYEIALFQGHTMGYVPVVIDQTLGLEGKPWEEVVILGGNTDRGTRQTSEEEAINDEWRDQGSFHSGAYEQSGAYQHDDEGLPPELRDEERPPYKPVGYFPLIVRNNLNYFGFDDLAPDEKAFKTAFKRMLMANHPDHLGLEATDKDRERAEAATKEINTRRDMVVKELQPYWGMLIRWQARKKSSK